MADLIIPNMRDGYVELVQYVQDHGEEVAPRGFKTKEVEDMTFTLEDPLDALPLGVGRNPKLAIPAAEALLLCGGIGDPTLLTNITGVMRRFLDGGQLTGAYGPRVRSQFAATAQRLMNDRDSRQAVMTIWDPTYDLVDTRDVPCTLSFNFRVRKGKLNMSATMRSNDVFLGTAYDVFMFTQLQATMANVIGVDLGTYTHHAYSFHLYERNAEDVEKLHAYDRVVHNDELYPQLSPLPRDHPKAPDVIHYERRPAGFGYRYDDSEHGEPWDIGVAEFATERARSIHSGETIDLILTKSEAWYEQVLKPYERLTRTKNFTA